MVIADESLMERATELHRHAVVIDMHAHGSSLLTPRMRRVVGALPGMPDVEDFPRPSPARMRLTVASAVGDRMVTGWHTPVDRWTAVRRQLRALHTESVTSGVPVTTRMPVTDGSGVLLGLEGADVVGDDPGRLSQLYRAGVRVLGLVHYADNALGTMAMSLLGRRGGRAVRSGRRARGLTALGRDVVAEANRLGMVVDVAHADRATTLAVCAYSTAPVISSHTGAASVRDFPRYVGDEEATAIAATGGVIGLWPFGFRGRGMADLAEFARHAEHLAQVVGVEHLCIGTDINGVPGFLDGFAGSADLPSLTAALLRAGFDDAQALAVLGGNAARVLSVVLDQPRS